MTARLDFVVIGAQRGGSTQLSSLLTTHPQVFMPADEVPYFEDPFYLNSSPTALAAVFATAGPRQKRGVHCPSYLARPEVADRLHRFSPGASIIVVLRDPVARAVSAYYWYVQFGMLPLQPADVGLGRLLDGWSDPRYPQAWEVLDWSRYGHHLAPFVDRFGRGQVFALLSQDLATAVRPALREIYQRLGIEPGHQPSGPVRRNEGVYDLRRLRVLRARRRFAWSWSETDTYSYRRRRLRHPVRFLPNATIVAFDRLVLRRLFNRTPPALPAELDARLRDHFAADLDELEPLLGLDLSAWRSPPGRVADASAQQSLTSPSSGSSDARA